MRLSISDEPGVFRWTEAWTKDHDWFLRASASALQSRQQSNLMSFDIAQVQAKATSNLSENYSWANVSWYFSVAAPGFRLTVVVTSYHGGIYGDAPRWVEQFQDSSLDFSGIQSLLYRLLKSRRDDEVIIIITLLS